MKNFFGAIAACVILALLMAGIGFDFWTCIIASLYGCMIGMILA